MSHTESVEFKVDPNDVNSIIHPFKPGDLVVHSDDGAIGMVTKLHEYQSLYSSGVWVIFGDGVHDEIPLSYLTLVDKSD